MFCFDACLECIGKPTQDISILQMLCQEISLDTLPRYLHFNDNANIKPGDHPEYDKLFKIKPLVPHLQPKFKGLKPEKYNFVDEQIIPYKEKYCTKQLIKNKPHKWGQKVFSRARASGIVYFFDLHQGKQTGIGSNP